MNFTSNSNNTDKNFDKNFKTDEKCKDLSAFNYFQAAGYSENKNPFKPENKKEVFAFCENKVENCQNSQTAFKAKDPFGGEKASEAFAFGEREGNELNLNCENNAKYHFKAGGANENSFGNFTDNNPFSNNQNRHQSEESTENLEEVYKRRMNNFMNYYDKKQKEKENEVNQANNFNKFNKTRNYNNNINNNHKINFEDEEGNNLNAKPVKRGQNVDFEDFTNSIYNVNRKKKNNNNNNFNKNKKKNNEEDEEEEEEEEGGSSYNIYANKKVKKPNNRFNREEENEGFLIGGELKNENNANFKRNQNKSNNNYRQANFGYQNQLCANKDEGDLEDAKFNEALKKGSNASNYLANKMDNSHNFNKKNQNSFSHDSNNNNNNLNKARNSNDNANKFSVKQKFIPPKMNNSTDESNFKHETDNNAETNNRYEELDRKLKGCDPKLIELIESEILSSSPDVKWDDIAGLEFAKKTIKEIIIWPMLRPDIFKGIRKPPKGLLLFGPPGTGKTMIAKAIASESKSSFFNISASSLMSKWIGESERLVRTLFALASFHQPSVVFIDEIDSILTSRSENENESSRRIKTEFLVQLDGAGTNQDDRILIIGATNRPQEIDEAFIRRLSKRLYIPLPNKASRKQLVENVISKESEKNNKYSTTENDLAEILNITKGYSGSDLMGVCREAAMMPIRSIEDILAVSLDNIRDVCLNDFKIAVELVKPSVSEKTIGQYVQWNKDFGSFNFEEKDE